MEEIKRRFIDAVAARLSAAPQSTAKDELVEELSDNLYRRYLDMSSAGVPEEDAFRRSMEDLGDVDELLSYLGAEAAQPQGGAAEGRSDFDALLSGVSEVCNAAIDQTKAALKLAKEAIQRRTTVEKDNRRVRVHFNTRPGAPEAPADVSGPDGWEFEAELDSDQGRFFAGGGPSEKKDVLYGFGYDKARGGFFAQWGEGAPAARGPSFSGEGDVSMEHNKDDSYSVSALKDLRGIEVFTTSGDVSIHMSEAPDAGVIIDGDVDDLDVTCSADGVLTIREGRTAAASFFSLRGLRSADVELFLPCRPWETISVTTASGDVDIDRDALEADRLYVKTASGDLTARARIRGQLTFQSASGDFELKGACADLHAETMSGDIELEGQADTATLKTASGDIELEGTIRRIYASSMSGDIEVDTSQLPEAMDLSSKSGDCEARIPDAGPFSVRMKTVSGDLDCGFPVDYVNGAAVYAGGSGPAYSMNSVSGDVTLERR